MAVLFIVSADTWDRIFKSIDPCCRRRPDRLRHHEAKGRVALKRISAPAQGELCAAERHHGAEAQCGEPGECA